MHRHALIIGLLLGVPYATGCETVDSANVDTDGIYADFSLEATGNGQTKVTGSLRVGGSLSNTYVELTDGDRLNAYLGDEGQRMTEDTAVLGIRTYSTVFDGDDLGTVRIEFRRNHDSESSCDGADAPFSYATLPVPFDMTVANDQALSRQSDDLELSWSPAGLSDDMSLAVSGSCIDDYRVAIDDTGSYAVSAGTLQTAEAATTTDCQLTISLSRDSAGQIDPAFGEGGTFVARQLRSGTLDSSM